MAAPRSRIKDAKRIDVDDAAELEAWCILLKIEPRDLRTAVAVVGPMAAAVAVYVNGRNRRGAFRQADALGHAMHDRAIRTGGADADPEG